MSVIAFQRWENVIFSDSHSLGPRELEFVIRSLILYATLYFFCVFCEFQTQNLTTMTSGVGQK